MGLDIRLPIGLMFCVLGPILVATGLSDGAAMSLRTGAAMLAFGAIMLVLGIRGQRAQPASLSVASSSSSSSNDTT
jgi:hypothetical protein